MNKYGVMRRLITSEGDAKVCGEYIYHEDALEIEIDMGPITSSIWDLPLPKCPDCGGEVVWAEAGYVPGTRECKNCRSLFMIDTWSDVERADTLVLQWQRSRNEAKDEDVLAIDIAHSHQIGFPVLAAALDLLVRIESAEGPISPREMAAELSPLISLARGEAQTRLNAALSMDAHGSRSRQAEIPGIVTCPVGVTL